MNTITEDGRRSDFRVSDYFDRKNQAVYSMPETEGKKNKRILIVDSDPTLWGVYESVLCPRGKNMSMEKLSKALAPDGLFEPEFDFELSVTARGEDALGLVRASVENGKPFALAIVDINRKTPSGWDGVETAAGIRRIDPNVEIVITAGHSDFSRNILAKSIDNPKNLMLLRKPFDLDELEQTILCLSEKRNSANESRDQKNPGAAAAAFDKDSKKTIRAWNPRLNDGTENQGVKYRGFFENAPDGMFLAEAEGRFLNVNSALAKMLGYDSPVEMTKCVKNVRYDLFHNPAENDKFRNSIDANGVVRDYETRFRRKDGGICDVSLNVLMVGGKNGNRRYYEGIVQDAAKKTRFAGLMQKTMAAESLARSKTRFMKMMSLGFGATLVEIIRYAELVRMADSSENRLNYADRIAQSARFLAEMTKDIHEYSRIDAGELELECAVFNPYEMLKNISGQFRHRAEQKGTELVFSASDRLPEFLVGDRFRLSQVISNIIDNALKFTDKGKIIVQATLVEETPNHAGIRFTITDTGTGISEKEMANLFEPFARTDMPTSPKFGGSGLGLAFCKRLVKMMGGHIWAESEPGKGATFHFTAEFEIREISIHDFPVGPIMNSIENNAEVCK